MTDDVRDAMLLLYKMESRTRSTYTIELIDRALDQLTRNSDRVGDPRRLVKSALGNASKVLNKRKELWLQDSRSFEELNLPPVNESEYLIIEITEFLNKSLSSHDCEILLDVLNGYDIEDIAKERRIPINRLRVSISRARARARNLWNTG